MDLTTIGDYVQIGLAILAAILIPRAILRAWWPTWRRYLARGLWWLWSSACRAILRDELTGEPMVITPREAGRAIVGSFMAQDVMSRSAGVPVAAADTEAVHVLVRDTGTSERTTDDYDMPRVGRRLRDDEIVALLATQKGEAGGGYRFTANQIYELVKGTRADVLDQIKAIRAGPPAPQVRQHQARLDQLTAAANGRDE